MIRFLLIYFVLIVLAEAKPPAREPLLIKADEVTYLRETNCVLATGNVLVFNNNRTLLAQQVTYDRNTNIIDATGDVWLRTATNDYVWTPHIQIKADLQEGAIDNLRIILNDNSRFAALKGVQGENESTELTEAVYSPCRVCRQNEAEKAPLWQIKAEKITHNRQEEIVQYKNARLEILGVPIIYTPYFRHPDPTVKRKSGLLIPTFTHSNDLGFLYGQPVYITVDPSRDLTLTPMITSKQGPVMMGEYRQRTINSSWLFNGSYTRSHNLPAKTVSTPLEPQRDRWHGIVKSRVEFTDAHLLTIDFNRASDTTYLRRYPILSQRTQTPQNKNLTSEINLEQFLDNSYSAAHLYTFQTDNQSFTPIVLPVLTYDYRSTPGKYGQFFGVTGSFLSLRRSKDLPGQFPRSSQRFSTSIGGEIPYISPWGDEWRGMLWLRSDLYRIHSFRKNFTTPSQGMTEGRLLPQGAIQYRYPFTCGFWLLEPQAMLVSSPSGGNSANFPNEDSANVELDYSNLFSLNRFPGYDRLDSGSRFIYGLNNRFRLPGNRLLLIFLGQTRRLDRRPVFPVNAGEDAQGSDVVTRLKIDPWKWLDFHHQSRLSRKKLAPRVSETYVMMNVPYAKLQTGHIYLSSQPTLAIPRVHQLNWQLTTNIQENWTVSYGESRNLDKGTEGILARLVSVNFQNECLQVSAGFYQTKYRDRDIKPDSGFLLQLSFKNLGTFTPITSPISAGDVFPNFYS